MSIHRSLKPKGRLTRHRSVLSRTEQLEVLEKEERWKEGESVFGLPKVRVFQTKRKKIKKEVEATDDADGTEGVTDGTAVDATPAAGEEKA